MPQPSDVTVVGAGIVGLSCALQLADAGARVRLIDAQGEAAANASSIAAGMLAPASEALAEGGTPERFTALLHARDRWPPFAARVPGLIVHRDGADRYGPADAPEEALEHHLQRTGVEFEVHRGGGPLRLPQDWRVEVSSGLVALRAALLALGVRCERGRVAVGAHGRLQFGDDALQSEVTLIAAGLQAVGLEAAAPELAGLSPIKGQILHFHATSPGGPTRRTPQGYVVPQADGARAGGTMEVGRDDTQVDPSAVEALHRMAADATPELVDAPYTAHAGVRPVSVS